MIENSKRTQGDIQSEQHRKVCVISAVSVLVLLILAVVCIFLLRNIGGGGGGGGGGDGSGSGTGSQTGPGIGQATGTNISPDAKSDVAGERAETNQVEQDGNQADIVFTDRLTMATVILNPGTPPPPATAPGGRSAGAGGGQGGGSGDGRGSGRGSGEGSGVGETKFMGAKAEGRTFIYIVDCSGSMKGSKLDETKTELMASIRMLTSRQQKFFVFFYDNTTYPWPGPQSLRYAIQKNIDDCETWARSITGGGGTEPTDALLAAIGMNPDVIFFMSDGLFDEKVCDKVRVARGNKLIAIHTISFIDKSGESVMRRIAEENRGAYRFEPGRTTSP